MRQLFHPEIPTTGDLSLDIIAQFIGPYVDFWRVTVGHTLYWIHVLLLSRLLFYLNPLIMTSQSNLVAAMIESGDLVTAWTMIPVSDAEEFVTGNSPPHLNQYFPDNVNYRNFRAGEFNARLGSISLVRTGRDKSRISLHIPAGDAGRYKYDPTMAYRRWVVDFLVRIVSETVIHVSTRRLHEEAEIDWNEPEEVYQWLTVVKATAQEKLVQAGITTVLEVSKNAARRVEFVLTFLRSLQSSKRAHERWLENGVRAAQPRREGTLTVGKPFSGDRRQQVLDIVKDAQDLDLYDLPPDPNHFGSFPHPILSQSFMLWLLALAEGTGIVYASNALGRTQAGYKAAQARNQKFGEWRHSSGVDISAIERRDLVQSVKETAGAAAYLCDELHRSARYAHCRRCDSFVIARHNDSKHRCSADNNQPKQVTATEFPDIERVLYPHDLLNNPLMLAALGDRNDILAEVGLVAFAAQSILDSGQLILSKVLPVKDFSAFSALPACNSYIYIPETQINNKDLLLTLAVDVVLKSNSTCPEHFLPVDPQYRLAWRQNQSTLLMSWFSKGFSGGMCLGLLVLRDLVDFDSLVYRNTQYVSHLLPWCSWDHHAAPLLLVRQSQGTCAE
jgi:hypothetical protein